MEVNQENNRIEYAKRSNQLVLQNLKKELELKQSNHINTNAKLKLNYEKFKKTCQDLLVERKTVGTKQPVTRPPNKAFFADLKKQVQQIKAAEVLENSNKIEILTLNKQIGIKYYKQELLVERQAKLIKLQTDKLEQVESEDVENWQVSNTAIERNVSEITSARYEPQVSVVANITEQNADAGGTFQPNRQQQTRPEVLEHDLSEANSKNAAWHKTKQLTDKISNLELSKDAGQQMFKFSLDPNDSNNLSVAVKDAGLNSVEIELSSLNHQRLQSISRNKTKIVEAMQHAGISVRQITFIK